MENADGISGISVEVNEDKSLVILKVRVGDKWLDLMMREMEAAFLANNLLGASTALARPVEQDPTKVYNKTREEGTYMSSAQVQKARKELELIEGGKV